MPCRRLSTVAIATAVVALSSASDRGATGLLAAQVKADVTDVAADLTDAANPALPVRLTDTHLVLARTTLEPGAVTLVVRNTGRAVGRLVVTRVTPNARLVTAVSGLEPGTTTRRTVALAVGSYTLTASRAGVTDERLRAVLTVRRPPQTPAPGRTTAPTTPTRTGDPVNGARLFATLGCGGCHTFAAAGASGDVGPTLDQSNLSATRLATILVRGRAGMPSYAERATQQEIADLVAYITSANASRAADPAGTPPG